MLHRASAKQRRALRSTLQQWGQLCMQTLTQSIHMFAGLYAGKRCFYARPPYLNADLGAGSHVTRFISLAEVGGWVGGGDC